MKRTVRRHPKKGGVPSDVGHAVLLLCWGVLVGGLLAPTPVTAQTTDETTLIERYRMARYRVLARRYLRRMGRLPIYPPRPLPTPTDSLFPAPSSRDTATAERPAFPLHDVRPVRHLEQTWFRERFAETEWAFLGETPRPTFFDTTRTLDLRARLQAQFGSPTRTLADKPLRKPPGERPQFEYWFVVNDSIPVQVMDVRGPKGRGLIVAADQAYRDRLPALRRALLAPLRHSDRAPFVDYFYDRRRKRWYRVGFDGDSFFVEQIPSTRVVPGRRARLDTVRTAESTPPSGDGSL